MAPLCVGYSRTSGMNAARYSNSPLSSGICSGYLAAHAAHCSSESWPLRIALMRWLTVICQSALSLASRALRAVIVCSSSVCVAVLCSSVNSPFSSELANVFSLHHTPEGESSN